MDRANRYESMYSKVVCFFSVTGILYSLTNGLGIGDFSSEDIWRRGVNCFFFAAVIILNGIKHVMLKRVLFSSKPHYIAGRIVEITIFVLALALLELDFWIYVISLLLIITSSLSYGTVAGLCITAFYGALQIIVNIAVRMIKEQSMLLTVISTENYVQFLFIYFIAVIFSLLCGMIYHDTYFTEQQNKRLLKELEEKYDLLSAAQQEIENHYEKVKETNHKLEESNKKLSISIGEFYTLQQVSQAISSIFEIKELLKYVNDIIIGVMGVNYSTIILYDDKRDRLTLHTTNIAHPEELTVFSENANCSALKEALCCGQPMLENFVDDEEYPFTYERDIRSMICVPLMTKTTKYGLVLVEHKYNNAFSDGNVRLLDILAQQVSIAMENAHLYQKMQELASIDGLTEVYNRLYFQQRLVKELKSAADGKYYLAIAIFDIDHFKDFNDTYGHIFGDKVIRCIAEKVKNSLSTSDIIARYGGEEFIILFPKTDIQEAYVKVENLRQQIANTVIRDELIVTSVTASFGLSCYPHHGISEMEVLRKADKALYKAKASGRNCVKIAQ